ncbi:MAG: arginase, partial [Bacteroidota bacterium]|nr:arginase [Bacteroidota bacterium]
MSDYLNITDFLVPVNKDTLSNNVGYKEGQIGKTIQVFEETFPDLDDVQMVLVGCGEQRGAGLYTISNAADEVRREFYNLFYWHIDVRLGDVGNIKIGNTLADTHAALKTVIHELINIGKTVVILGGSNDLMLAQYFAFADDKQSIDAVGIDALVDINIDSPLRSEKFLMEMFTAEPN